MTAAIRPGRLAKQGLVQDSTHESANNCHTGSGKSQNENAFAQDDPLPPVASEELQSTFVCSSSPPPSPVPVPQPGAALLHKKRIRDEDHMSSELALGLSSVEESTKATSAPPINCSRGRERLPGASVPRCSLPLPKRAAPRQQIYAESVAIAKHAPQSRENSVSSRCTMLEQPQARLAEMTPERTTCHRSTPAAPLFAPSVGRHTASWAVATKLPTPARSRSPRLSKAPLVDSGHQALYVLDGLNILKSRNRQTSLMGDVDLEWDQLESACRYYVSRNQQISVYMPPLRLGHEERLERCRKEFGDIFVLCRSASDDRFMINTVKLYEDQRAGQPAAGDKQSRGACACYIVTNDRFEDWRMRGDVDAAWVGRHCIRFAFGPGGCFVPSELI